ncbi:MAG: haloacid dehalogenase-like hydrolase [Elusimicrobia bacterium]|nr:haloacid dehalogenase-like hydrolase [Elusimicrobiota bacterium]
MLRLALLVLLAAPSRAALTVRVARAAPVPVPGLSASSVQAAPLAGPSLSAPFLSAPALLSAAPALAPSPQAAAPMAPVPSLVPAAEALADPEPARLPAVLGQVFDGSPAPGFAPPGPVSALGGLSAAGEAAFARYAAGAPSVVPESDDGRETWTKERLLAYRDMLADISAALPKDATFIYPFMGPDAIPALTRPIFPIEYDKDDFRRGRDMAEKVLGLGVSALDQNLLTREPIDVRKLEDYGRQVDRISGPRVLLLKDFWRYSQTHPGLLEKAIDRLLRPGDMVLVLREGDVRLMLGAEALGLSRVGRIQTITDPDGRQWTEHPVMDFKVLTLPTAFSLWVKGQVAAAPVSLTKPAPLSSSWLPENQARLDRLIRRYGEGSPGYDPKKPPVAAFDWDNTMVRNDIGEAVFFRAVRELGFKSDEPGFWDLIPEEFGRSELRRAYEALKGLPLEQARGTPEYRRYRKLFHEVYERVKKEGPDLGLDYGWLVQLMAGYTKEELERYADETIAQELAKPLGEEEISGFDGDPQPIRIPAGIRPHAEMFGLAKRLREAGWDVRIVSATAEWVVARFAARAGIPAGHVHGVRAAVSRGRLTTRLTQRTWGQGKADVLRRRAGRAPRLAAGDSNSDLRMLESSRGESLVVDRGTEPLRSQARARGWMIQPRFQP